MSDSPTEAAPALTRAELRRRAQGGQTASTTRRSSRTEAVRQTADDGVDLDVAVEKLADLAPEALAVPVREAVTPVVVAADAATVEASPIAVPTSPIVVPRRRSRRVAAAPTASAAAPTASAAAVDFAAPATKTATAPATTPVVDEFAAAARLFSFTGETAVMAGATPAEVAASVLDGEHVVAPSAPRRRGLSFRRVATTSFSIGVVGVVGLLAVGMTTPREAVAAATGTMATASVSTQLAGDVAPGARDIQAYVAPAEVQNAGVTRTDQYQTTTVAELAAESGISNFSNFFVNNPNSPVQWPFAVGVPISYGYGMRSGTMHEGLDFTPGDGSPVQSIAAGTVRIATESGGAFGVTVVIDHVVNGQKIASRYAHMQYGSLQVKEGQQIEAGTFIGRTGNTGRSFGAHTHVELYVDGDTPIDPLPWLRENAGG